MKNTKNNKVKIILIPILAILFVAVVLLSILLIKKNSTSDEVTANPTLAPTTAPPSVTVAPSVTPVPEVSETTFYPAYERVDGELQYGYIDGTGTFVIPPTFDYAYDFSDGVAIVTKDNTTIVIDQTGAVIFVNENSILPFHNGMAAFLSNVGETTLYGYINTKGETIIEPQFILADNFNENGQAYVSTPAGAYELIDRTGKVIETFNVAISNGYVYDLRDGYLLYSNNDTMKLGVLSVKGETVFEEKYNEITYLGHDLFAVKNPDLESFETRMGPAAIMNANGEQLTDYALYDLKPFEGDHTCAADSTSIHFIGLDGQEDTSLPSYDGGGSLTLIGDIIKAELDSDLIYYRKDNTILWENDNTLVLSPEIKVDSVKFKPLRSVLVYYPQVEGMADSAAQKQVNEKLVDIFTESRSTITEEDLLSVDDSFQAELINHLLIIHMSGYDYPSGAAHGMPLQEYYFIDTITGTFYELHDLFKKDSDYITFINSRITADIEAQMKTADSMFFENSFLGITNDPGYYITADSLVMYFYPYDIAPYAAGFPEFMITFEELSPYLDTEGAFWKAFNDDSIS